MQTKKFLKEFASAKIVFIETQIIISSSLYMRLTTSKLENEARANTTTNAINVRMSVAWHQRWKLVFWTRPEPEVDVSFYANTMLPCPWVPIKGLYVERYLKIQKFNEINTKYKSINFSIFLGRGAVMGWRQRGYIVCFTLISMLKWITMFTLKKSLIDICHWWVCCTPPPHTHNRLLRLFTGNLDFLHFQSDYNYPWHDSPLLNGAYPLQSKGLSDPRNAVTPHVLVRVFTLFTREVTSLGVPLTTLEEQLALPPWLAN